MGSRIGEQTGVVWPTQDLLETLVHRRQAVSAWKLFPREDLCFSATPRRASCSQSERAVLKPGRGPWGQQGNAPAVLETGKTNCTLKWKVIYTTAISNQSRAMYITNGTSFSAISRPSSPRSAPWLPKAGTAPTHTLRSPPDPKGPALSWEPHWTVCISGSSRQGRMRRGCKAVKHL